jgi:hypothetical protein
MSFSKCPSCGGWLASDDEWPIAPCKCHRKPCGTQPTAHNTGSPKLPCPHLDNVGGCIKTVGHKKCTCDFVNRQLRAGA